MVLPGVDRMTVAELEQFRPTLLLLRPGDPRRQLGHLRPDLRRPAADPARAPQAAGVGRPADADALDGGELRPDGVGQPAAEQGGRLALVHRLAVPLRRRGRVGDRPGRGRSAARGGAARRRRGRAGHADPGPALGPARPARGSGIRSNLLAAMVRAGHGHAAARPSWTRSTPSWLAIGAGDPRRDVARLRRRSSACSCRGSGRSPRRWPGAAC